MKRFLQFWKNLKIFLGRFQGDMENSKDLFETKTHVTIVILR